MKLRYIGYVLSVGLAVIFISLPACSREEKQHSYLAKNKSGSVEKKRFTPEAEDITTDEADGLKIIKDVINVTFTSTTDEETVKKLVAEVNGKIVGYDKAVNFYQIRLPGVDLKTLDAIRFKLLAKKEVETASRVPVSVQKNYFYVK